ncbi:MAG: formylmethanofuran--tetrahydromethanopterin N-formyltransferase [Anaerolineaceae bacterium]|nr:formylmethanofuran--tetrahydromethanopterin N-formyltransferase [Anaerolineaceae bacterium]
MQIEGVTIEDTFAEAFPMWMSRLVITADTARLAFQAAQAACGLGISIIGCGCEAGVEGELDPDQTADGRPGQALFLFSYSKEKLEDHLTLRIGQAILPSATSACFNGLESTTQVKVGGKLRFFGDGYQSSKLLKEKRYWRIPVADGEFVVEEAFGMAEGVGGGNLLIIGTQRAATLEAAEAAAQAVRSTKGAIAPFPGGVCRSPSKPGSKYEKVRASTNQAFCPTLRTRVETQLPPQAGCSYELVINGTSEGVVKQAMAAAIRAACRPGVLWITAGNYGGKLGPYHLYLHQILKEYGPCASS